MGKEIERKFLVNDKVKLYLNDADSNFCIQTYISSDSEKIVRARVLEDKGFITIKSKVVGFSRHEFEYEIPKADALELIELFGNNVIEKTRYLIPHGNHTWEVDLFSGLNNGLIVAEIELNSENEQFELPEWIDKEVSGDVKYYNNNLQKKPFCEWDLEDK